MTSEDRCYCGAHGTCAVAASTYNNNVQSDISELLLQPLTIVTSYRGPFLLWGHVAHTRVLLVPTIATDRLTSADHCNYHS
jgi:hypothetical protein